MSCGIDFLVEYEELLQFFLFFTFKIIDFDNFWWGEAEVLDKHFSPNREAKIKSSHSGLLEMHLPFLDH